MLGKVRSNSHMCLLEKELDLCNRGMALHAAYDVADVPIIRGKASKVRKLKLKSH